MPGYKLPPLMFRDGEEVALAVGLLAARRLGLSSTHIDIESAQVKLERVMPLSLQSQVRALSQTVNLDVAAAPASTVSAAIPTMRTCCDSAPPLMRTNRFIWCTAPHQASARRGMWTRTGWRTGAAAGRLAPISTLNFSKRLNPFALEDPLC